jgi:hypothetical protein
MRNISSLNAQGSQTKPEEDVPFFEFFQGDFQTFEPGNAGSVYIYQFINGA